MTSPETTSRERRAYFEGIYEEQQEPWRYSGRAAEVLRHDTFAELIRSIRPSYARILDVGCSQGQLTARLVGLAPEIHAMDISSAALRRARARCAEAAANGGPRQRTSAFHFCQGSSLALPFPAESVDLVLLCDGIHSWRLSPEEQAAVLREAHRVLVPGGTALLSDHLKPTAFDTLIGRVQASPLGVQSVRYLHNRLWYSLERGLSPLGNPRWVQALLGSKTVARGLGALSRLAGRRGAKHLSIVAQKDPPRIGHRAQPR